MIFIMASAGIAYSSGLSWIFPLMMIIVAIVNMVLFITTGDWIMAKNKKTVNKGDVNDIKKETQRVPKRLPDISRHEVRDAKRYTEDDSLFGERIHVDSEEDVVFVEMDNSENQFIHKESISDMETEETRDEDEEKERMGSLSIESENQSDKIKRIATEIKQLRIKLENKKTEYLQELGVL